MKLKVEKILEKLNLEISMDKVKLDSNLNSYEFNEMKKFCINNISDVAYLLEHDNTFVEKALFEKDNFSKSYLDKYEIDKEWFKDFCSLVYGIGEDFDFLQYDYLTVVDNLRPSYVIMNCILIECKQNAILQLERYLENGYIADIDESKLEKAVNLLEECLN